MNNLEFDSWFPTIIGRNICPFFDKIKNPYIKYLNNKKLLNSNLETNSIYDGINIGFKYYQIHKDKKFKKLCNWITDCVNEYAKKHLFYYEYEPKESWLVDYKDHSNQPWHSHKGHTISTVFYLSSNKEDSKILFRSPIYNDIKNPQNIKVEDGYKSNPYNEFTYPTCFYKPIEGMLLIFRSFVEHSTEQKILKDNKRIVFSINYDPK
jgi:hypothetical protein